MRVFLFQESLYHGAQANPKRTPGPESNPPANCSAAPAGTSCSLGRRSNRVCKTRRRVGCVLLVNSNDAMCLDIVEDLELCTHDTQGVAVNFLVTDRPEPVSFLVPEIARALLEDKWKQDHTARE